MNTNITLFDLMQLNEGQLSDTESAILHEAIRGDQDLNRRWTVLRQAFLRLLEPPTTQLASGTDVSPALVASYLDQRLAANEAAVFEERCWQDSSLLLEVLDGYQASMEPPYHGPIPEASTRNLLELFPQPGPAPESVESSSDTIASSSINVRPINGKTRITNGTNQNSGPDFASSCDEVENTRPDEKKINQKANGNTPPAPPDALPFQLDLAESNRDFRRLPRSRSQQMWWSTAAAIVLIALTWLAVAQFRSTGPQVVDEENRVVPKNEPRDPGSSIPESNPIPGVEKDALATDNDPVKDRDPKTSKVNDDDESLPMRNDDPFRSLVNDPKPDNSEKSPQPSPRSPSRNNLDPDSPGRDIVDNRPPSQQPKRNPETMYPSEASLKWQKIEGLVAIRDRYESTWSVAGDKPKWENGSVFKTFPGSWAMARTSGESTLILDEDSSVMVRANESGSRFQIALEHGKTGFKSVGKGTRFDIQAARLKLTMEALEPDSEFGVDFVEEGPRVFVRKGQVTINGMTVSKGESASPDDSRRLDLTVFASMKTFDEFRWLTQSQTKPVAIVRNALADSNQLDRDLAQLMTSKNATIQIAAVQWRLSMDEGASLTRCFSSNVKTIREAAFDWLMNLNRHDPRTKRVWRTLKADFTRRAQVRPQDLSKLDDLLNSSQADWQDSDVRLLVRMLDHQDWFPRMLAFHLLNGKFGATNDYHPDLLGNTRTMAARRWSQVIDAKLKQ